MELFQTFRSEKRVKAFTQMTFIEGRCLNAQSKVDLHAITLWGPLTHFWPLNFHARTHARAGGCCLRNSGLNWDFCPEIFTPFSVYFIAYWISQDWQMLCWRDSCQHSIQQLGQVLLTSVTSPLLWRLCLCPPRLCDLPMCHLCSLEAFEGTSGTLEALNCFRFGGLMPMNQRWGFVL